MVAGSLAYSKYTFRGGNIRHGGGDEKYGICTIEVRKKAGVFISGDGAVLDTGCIGSLLPFNDGPFLFFIGGTEGGDFVMKQVLDRVLVADKLVFAYVSAGHPDLEGVEEFQAWLDSSGTTGNSVNCAGFFFDDGESPNWHIFSKNPSGQTVTDTGVAVIAGLRERLELIFDNASLTFTFKINGVSVGTINTNIPINVKLAMGSSVHTLDATSRTLRIDSWELTAKRVT